MQRRQSFGNMVESPESVESRSTENTVNRGRKMAEGLKSYPWLFSTQALSQSRPYISFQPFTTPCLSLKKASPFLPFQLQCTGWGSLYNACGQHVIQSDHLSLRRDREFTVRCHQGSVLGLEEFIAYAEDLDDIIGRHHLQSPPLRRRYRCSSMESRSSRLASRSSDCSHVYRIYIDGVPPDDCNLTPVRPKWSGSGRPPAWGRSRAWIWRCTLAVTSLNRWMWFVILVWHWTKN